MYSALSLSQVSIEVNNLNSFTFFSSMIGFSLLINLSKSFGLAPRLEFMFNSRFGIGFLLISSNNLYVLPCIVGSPPVILSMFSVLETSGHHFHHASIYGLSSSDSYNLSINQSISYLPV